VITKHYHELFTNLPVFRCIVYKNHVNHVFLIFPFVARHDENKNQYLENPKPHCHSPLKKAERGTPELPGMRSNTGALEQVQIAVWLPMQARISVT
jgi:hypothetical protein